MAASVQAQINNNPPGGNGPTGRGRGPGVEASVVTNVRSPEVNADNTITFRLPAPNAKKVRVYTDMPKLGDTPVNGSAGFDMTKDANGVWSFTTPKLAPSYYQRVSLKANYYWRTVVTSGCFVAFAVCGVLFSVLLYPLLCLLGSLFQFFKAHEGAAVRPEKPQLDPFDLEAYP